MKEDNVNDCAVLFAGQGAQLPGMGRELAESNSDAMELWRKGEAASGLNLRGIYWEGSEEEMADTRALQPALTVVNLNIWRAGKYMPMALAGHSLGEFSAIAASGALGIGEILDIVSLRGRLMAQANGGAMAAVLKLPREEVETIVADIARVQGGALVCANYNTPVQTVISGTLEAVNEGMARAKDRKGRAMRLAVSGAFHSPLMADANLEFVPRLRKAKWSDPHIPVFCNVTGKMCRTGEGIRNNLERQMISPVLWVDIIKGLNNNGVKRFVEIGPKSVLGKMVVQCAGEECHVELAGD